jgi:hypothetical protein
MSLDPRDIETSCDDCGAKFWISEGHQDCPFRECSHCYKTFNPEGDEELCPECLEYNAPEDGSDPQGYQISEQQSN